MATTNMARAATNMPTAVALSLSVSDTLPSLTDVGPITSVAMTPERDTMIPATAARAAPREFRLVSLSFSA
jgi:hypothetical protein